MHFVNARLSCVLNGALDLNLPEAITRVSVFLFSCNALTHSLTHSPTVSPYLPFLLLLLLLLHPPKTTQYSSGVISYFVKSRLHGVDLDSVLLCVHAGFVIQRDSDIWASFRGRAALQF